MAFSSLKIIFSYGRISHDYAAKKHRLY